MEKLRYHVPDLACDRYLQAITTGVRRVPGVGLVSFDLVNGFVVVTGQWLDEGAVRAAIVGVGDDPYAS